MKLLLLVTHKLLFYCHHQQQLRRLPTKFHKQLLQLQQQRLELKTTWHIKWTFCTMLMKIKLLIAHGAHKCNGQDLLIQQQDGWPLILLTLHHKYHAQAWSTLGMPIALESVLLNIKLTMRTVAPNKSTTTALLLRESTAQKIAMKASTITIGPQHFK